MTEQSVSYHAYLVRFWREDERAPWRASLEDPHTGESFRFASARHLYEFLNKMLDTPEENTVTQTSD